MDKNMWDVKCVQLKLEATVESVEPKIALITWRVRSLNCCSDNLFWADSANRAEGIQTSKLLRSGPVTAKTNSKKQSSSQFTPDQHQNP